MKLIRNFECIIAEILMLQKKKNVLLKHISIYCIEKHIYDKKRLDKFYVYVH